MCPDIVGTKPDVDNALSPHATSTNLGGHLNWNLELGMNTCSLFLSFFVFINEFGAHF